MTIQQSGNEPIVVQTPAEAARTSHYGDYAGSITRLVAFLIDGLIVATVIGIFAFVGSFLGDFLRVQGGTLRFLQFVTVIISLLFYAGYFVGLWQLAGKTIGKQLMGLVVVAEDGGRITFGRAVRRYVGYYISAILMLGYIWILLDPRRQGWHDKLAGTLVLYDWPEQLLLANYVDEKTELQQQESARRRRLRQLSAAQQAPVGSAESTSLTTAE